MIGCICILHYQYWSMLCPYTPGSYLQHRSAQCHYVTNRYHQYPRLLELINFSRHDKPYFFALPLVSNFSSFCALFKEPPIVQLAHPALWGADILGENHIPVTLFDTFATHTVILVFSESIIFVIVQTHLNILLHPEVHENKHLAHVHCHSAITVLRKDWNDLLMVMIY